MLELPTIKIDFLFENSQDFNQTTHARPQHPIVFIHNISLYFNCISSVKYVLKWSSHCHVMSFSAVRPKQFNAPNHKIEYTYFERQKKCLHVVQNGSFLLFFHFKMVAYEVGYKGSSEKLYHVISFCNYFKTTLRPN